MTPARCFVCDAAVDGDTAVRLMRWPLCPTHADLAVHAARKMSDTVATAGLTHEKQAALADAYDAARTIWRSVRSLGREAGRESTREEKKP